MSAPKFSIISFFNSFFSKKEGEGYNTDAEAEQAAIDLMEKGTTLETIKAEATTAAEKTVSEKISSLEANVATLTQQLADATTAKEAAETALDKSNTAMATLNEQVKNLTNEKVKLSGQLAEAIGAKSEGGGAPDPSKEFINSKTAGVGTAVKNEHFEKALNDY